MENQGGDPVNIRWSGEIIGMKFRENDILRTKGERADHTKEENIRDV